MSFWYSLFLMSYANPWILALSDKSAIYRTGLTFSSISAKWYEKSALKKLSEEVFQTFWTALLRKLQPNEGSHFLSLQLFLLYTVKSIKTTAFFCSCFQFSCRRQDQSTCIETGIENFYLTIYFTEDIIETYPFGKGGR